MENLNETQSAPQTANPQTAGGAGPANDSADFQQTAPSDTLEQENQSLGVQESGRLPSAATVRQDNSMWFWGVGILVSLVVIVVITRLLMAEDKTETQSTPAGTKSSSSAKKTSVSSKSAVKKTAVSKKKVTKKRQTAASKRKKR